jgi:hypothetical protein
MSDIAIKEIMIKSKIDAILANITGTYLSQPLHYGAR